MPDTAARIALAAIGDPAQVLTVLVGESSVEVRLLPHSTVALPEGWRELEPDRWWTERVDDGTGPPALRLGPSGEGEVYVPEAALPACLSITGHAAEELTKELRARLDDPAALVIGDPDEAVWHWRLGDDGVLDLGVLGVSVRTGHKRAGLGRFMSRTKPVPVVPVEAEFEPPAELPEEPAKPGRWRTAVLASVIAVAVVAGLSWWLTRPSDADPVKPAAASGSSSPEGEAPGTDPGASAAPGESPKPGQSPSPGTSPGSSPKPQDGKTPVESGKYYSYSGKTYVTSGGALRQVANKASLLLLTGGRPPTAAPLDDAGYAALPHGEPIGITGAPEPPSLNNGTVLYWKHAKNGKYYQALNNAAHVTDLATLTGIAKKLGRSEPNIAVHTDAEIMEKANNTIDRTLAYRVDGGSVGGLFLISGGKKYPVADLAAAQALGYNSGQITYLAGSWLDAFGTGPQLRTLSA
ncbi:type VII secretion protein EccB [Actinorhabdospora filicis]|nr:type VII secretion protein EccB [Actinorhabdospora filicis]